MSRHSLSYLEQLLPYKIKGQSRPFIDEDLQMQIPGLESSLDRQGLQHYSHIYSHYLGYLNQPSPHLNTHLSEEQLEAIKVQTQQSFEAWKKMHDSILEGVQKI